MCIAPERYLIWQQAQWGGVRWPEGYIPFAHTATGTLNRSPVFVLGNNVGIGTTSPRARLDIAGGLRALSATITGTTTLPQGIWRADGNVGIGTTSPRARLEVSGVMRLTPTTTEPQKF